MYNKIKEYTTEVNTKDNVQTGGIERTNNRLFIYMLLISRAETINRFGQKIIWQLLYFSRF